MRVFNQSKTQELTEYDLSKGYLKDDIITTHYNEVQEVQEVGHYETIAEYSNGGKDVKWVIDVEGVEYQPEKDVEEKIQVYVPFTQKELRIQEINNRISELKKLLADSDYRAIKYAEGQYTFQEYQPYLLQRKAWRDEINQLEIELNNL